MNLGVTLIFKEKHEELVSGVLKSSVINAEIENCKNEANKQGKMIADFYNYTFLGINDVFLVSGEVKHGEVLGRTSYYELDTITKAKKNVNNSVYDGLNFDDEFKNFKCSLVFFCQNITNEKYAITVISILENQNKYFKNNLETLGNSKSFQNKIIRMAKDDLRNLEFIGVESIEETDLNFNVFETLYSEFDSINQLTDEQISENDLKTKLKDIFSR